MENKDINISVNTKGEDKHISMMKWVFNTITNAKWKSILKVYFVTFFFLATLVILLFGYTAAKNSNIVQLTAEKLTSTVDEENIRDFIVTPRIQNELKIMVYSLNAERAFIFELHNGKKNTSGLPFRFADMTYEVTNEEKKVDRVAMEFQDIPLTLYKYPHFLQKQKIMIGTVEEIEDVDPEFAEHIREIGGKYLGMIYLNSRGLPLAFLCISYHDLNNVPNKDIIANKLNDYGNTITQMLDLRYHIEENE